MEKADSYFKDRRLLVWETAGIFWIIIIGSLLHFLYEWTNYSSIIGAIAPVNESVWEHLKLGYWSLFFYSLIEYRYYFKKVGLDLGDFFTAKFLGLATLEGSILLIFYTYTAFLKQSILWIDISSYIIGAFLCQLVSFLIIRRKSPRFANNMGLILFILFGLIMIAFTYFTPHLPIFKDGITGIYGLP